MYGITGFYNRRGITIDDPLTILTGMNNSLVHRGPDRSDTWIDKDGVEFAWSLPIDSKVNYGMGKIILNKLLSKYLPKTLFNRPKMGFRLPIGKWLKKDLRDWAESLIDEKKIKEEGYFFPHEVRKKGHEHLTGKRNWDYQLCNVLMFQQWLDTYGSTTKKNV